MRKRQKSFGLRVEVEEGRFEKALRLFKKKVDDAGLLKEVRERQEYVKPSIERKLKKNAAKKRWQKKLEKDTLPQKFF